MPFASINYGGLDIACLLFGHEWSANCSITHRFPTDITVGRSGRESRRPQDENLRFTMEVTLLLQDDEAQALRDALANLGTGYVGVPIWPDKLKGADWIERIYDPQAIINLDDVAIVPIGSVLNPAKTYAPLLVGHISEMPEITAVTDGMAELSFTLEEDSPWEFRVGINQEFTLTFSDGTPMTFSDGTRMTGLIKVPGSVGMWPPTLVPDWVTPPTDKPTQSLEYDRVGEQRERTIEGQEIPFQWAQEADFSLMERDDIRRLLLFFVGCQGARQSFTQPWWLHPGTPTPTAPASTVARFAEDSLKFDYETDGVVTATVGVIQVPWEIEGVEGEVPAQPGRAFLYKFTYGLPEQQYFRYTNWPKPLTNGDGTYTPAPMAHEKIDEGIDLKNEQISLDSFIFEGNPLMMFMPFQLEARLWLAIYEIDSDPVDASTAALRWYGEVRSVKLEGRKITAAAVFLGGLLDRQIPNVLIGPTCNTYLFSPRCKLLKADFQKNGTLTSISGNDLIIATAAGDADNTFAYGWIEVGAGATWELRSIIASRLLLGGSQKLTIDWPLRQAASGQSVVFWRGCDLTAATCTALGNFENFRGHPNLPLVNLSLPMLNPPQHSGKK